MVESSLDESVVIGVWFDEDSKEVVELSVLGTVSLVVGKLLSIDVVPDVDS